MVPCYSRHVSNAGLFPPASKDGGSALMGCISAFLCGSSCISTVKPRHPSNGPAFEGYHLNGRKAAQAAFHSIVKTCEFQVLGLGRIMPSLIVTSSATDCCKAKKREPFMINLGLLKKGKRNLIELANRGSTFPPVGSFSVLKSFPRS